jgi:hypothetical protein
MISEDIKELKKKLDFSNPQLMLDSLQPDEIRKLSSIASKLLSPQEIELIKSSGQTKGSSRDVCNSQNEEHSYQNTPREFMYPSSSSDFSNYPKKPNLSRN